MTNNDMITIRNKNTGEVKTVPRSQFGDKPTLGLEGIGEDVSASLESALPALGEMISSIPGGIKNVAKYAVTNNPVNTLANVGAGVTEGGLGIISSPQVLARYLAEKFPKFGKWMQDHPSDTGQDYRSPTILEQFKNFEKSIGFNPQSPEEESVRNLGGLLGGGKLLTKIPSTIGRTAAVTAQSAGQGGDPVHAAILGITGDMVAKAPWKKTAQIPSAIVDTAKNLPEIAGTAASTGLDAVAGLGKAAHIPAVPSLMETLSDYIKYKSIPPEKLAQRKLFSDIEKTDVPKINERMEAAKRLGLGYLTPAEATLSPFEAAKQGTIGRTSSGSKLLFEKGRERSTSEGTAINNLLDTIYDAKDLDPKKAAAYQETMTAQVPDEFIAQQMQRPVIQSAIKKLESKPAYKQKIQDELGITLTDEVKPNSFMYWDMVKRVLGDMGERAKENNKATTESDILADTRRSMVRQMDAIKPEYEVARGIAERKFTRTKLEDVFDKKTMTGNNFYKFLQSKRNFNDVMNKLKAFPEAQQKLKDMKLLFGDLIPNDMSIRSAAALKRTSMSDARNKLDAMKQALDEKYGKEHDVATIKLMTDPEWVAKFTEFLKNQKGSK